MRRLIRPFRINRHRSASSVIVLLSICLAAHGQDAKAPPAAGEIAAGSEVVLKSPDIPLRRNGQDRTVPSGIAARLKVDELDGNRVLVTDPGGQRRGWVDIDRVVSLDRAMAYFDAAIARNPKDAAAYQMRGQLWHAYGDTLRVRGQSADAVKEYDRALADFDRAIRLTPGLASAYLDRGWLLLYGTGKADQAHADFDKAAQLDPKRAHAYYQRAGYWMAKNDLARMKSDLDMALQLDPADPDALMLRILYRMRVRDIAGGIDDVDRLISLDPTYPYWYQQRGLLRAEAGDLDRAIADFSEAIRLAPREANAYRQRAYYRGKKGEVDRSIDDYSEAIRLDPKTPWVYVQRAAAWRKKGELDRAMADYDMLIRLSPSDVRAYIARGLEWERNRQPDKAMADYQKAIELDQRAAPAYEGRGRIWKSRGQFAMAITNFAELVRVAPKDPTGHRELARLLATCAQKDVRDGRRAAEEAAIACNLTSHQDPDSLEILAAAYAEGGSFDSAIQWQRRAIAAQAARSRAGGGSDRRRDTSMRDRLSLYERHIPYHEKPAPNGP